MSVIFHQPAIIQAALQQATVFLDKRGVTDSRLVIEWLFSRALNCARTELHLRRNNVLPPETLQQLNIQVNRLAADEPLQYVQGETEFMGHVFSTDRRALIPRPETEQLVESVLACDALRNIPAAIADVGTGSGCIVISLALAMPAGQYYALDIDSATLDLARENAARHGVRDRIRFAQGILLASLPAVSLDAVISNPPYVCTGDWDKLPSMIRNYEPRLALDGGADGLDVFHPLIMQAGRVLKPGGFLFLEIGDGQAEAIAGLLRENGFVDIAPLKDLAGKTRIATARRPLVANCLPEFCAEPSQNSPKGPPRESRSTCQRGHVMMAA